MLELNCTKNTSQSGFTLIELMVVIAIIGILAAIAIPIYSDYTSRTRATAMLAEIASVKLQVIECGINEGRFDDCDSNDKGITDISSFTATKNVITITSIQAGVIKGKSGATNANGVNLLFEFTPHNSGWDIGGSICNGTRGLNDNHGC